MQEQEEVLVAGKSLIISKLFQLSIFISLAVMAPYFGNQFLTGSFVNALLFIAVAMVGVEYALLLCFIPSLISIYVGLLSLALGPMIPFIMAGNVLLVLVFYKFGKKNFWVGALPAAVIKFVFIWSFGMLLANSVLKGIAAKLMLMISWPQLATALIGAVIAYFFLKVVNKIK